MKGTETFAGQDAKTEFMDHLRPAGFDKHSYSAPMIINLAGKLTENAKFLIAQS